MITFFRRIRQSLLSENKFSKYLIYAIGEIILVMVGILLALQVNNWNEGRKNSQKKETLLKALKIEFTDNLKQLDTVLYYDNKVFNNVQRFMNITQEDIIEFSKDSMPSWFQNISFRWTFDPRNGALNSGISSGDINLIRNDTLSNLLFGWQDLIADMKEGEIRTIKSLETSRPIIEKYIRNRDYRQSYLKELGHSRFKSDYQSLFKDPLFEDFLTERYLSMSDLLLELNDVRNKNEHIIKLLNNALTND